MLHPFLAETAARRTPMAGLGVRDFLKWLSVLLRGFQGLVPFSLQEMRKVCGMSCPAEIA